MSVYPTNQELANMEAQNSSYLGMGRFERIHWCLVGRELTVRTRGDLSGKFGPVLYRPAAGCLAMWGQLAAIARLTPAFAAGMRGAATQLGVRVNVCQLLRNQTALEHLVSDGRCYFTDEISTHLRIAVKKLYRSLFFRCRRRFFALLFVQLLAR